MAQLQSTNITGSLEVTGSVETTSHLSVGGSGSFYDSNFYIGTNVGSNPSSGFNSRFEFGTGYHNYLDSSLVIRPAGSAESFTNNYWSYFKNTGYDTYILAGNYHGGLYFGKVYSNGSINSTWGGFSGTSGHFGLGTTSPQERLHVAGNAVITGSNSLTGTYALKVANSSGTDILAVENDGNTKVYRNLIQENTTNFVNEGIIFKSAGGTYTGRLGMGLEGTAPYVGFLNFPHSANISLGNTSHSLTIRGGTTGMWSIGASIAPIYNSTSAGAANISAGHLGSFGFYTIGSTSRMPVMKQHNRAGNGDYGVKLIYQSASVEYDGITLDRYGVVSIPNNNLEVTNGLLNLNDSQNNIIISDQSPNLDSTSDNNIIVGLGAAQNMSGSGADRNIIIGTDAGKELSNVNTRYNTIIGYNAFSDHSGSNSNSHVVIGYNAGLGMSGDGGPSSATIIGANASSTNSFRTLAIGAGATSGYNGHAIGYQASADTDGALAIGANTDAGTSAIAIGNSTIAAAGSIAIGRNVNTTNGSAINIGSGGNTYQGVLIGSAARGTGNQGAAVGFEVGNGSYSVTVGYRTAKWNTGFSNVSIGRWAMQGVSGSTNISQTVAVGESALQNITTGTGNTAVGYQALKSTSTGGSNVAVGYLALANATTQTRNTAVGYGAFDEINGTNNVSYSTGLGYGVDSGGNSRVIVIGHNIYALGSNSVSIGGSAGYQGTTIGDSAKSNRGISIGWGAGGLLQGSTDHNIFIGNQSGYNGDGCSYNTFVGQFSGQNLSGGDNNVLLGYQSGYNVANGSNNIFLGYQSGYNETGSNKLYIENSTSSTPLIYGEFDNDLVRINGTFETSGSTTISGSLTVEGSGSTVFEVNGSEGQLFSITDSLSGSLFAVSDVSGLPILEVFSDDRVVAGTFNNEALVISGSHTTLKDTEITGSLDVSGSVGLTGSFNIYATGSKVPFVLDYDQTNQGDAFQINIANSNSNWRGFALNYTDSDGVTDPIGLRIGAYKPSNAMAFNAYNVSEFQFQGANSYVFSNELRPSPTYGIVSNFHDNLLFKLKSNDGRTYPVTSYRFRSDSSSGTGQNISGEIMRIGGNGSVGIGTATDTSASLHIKALSNLTGEYALRVTDNSSNDMLVVENDNTFTLGSGARQFYSTTTNQGQLSFGNTQLSIGPTNIQLSPNTGGDIIFRTSYTSSFILKGNTQNVGIGTTTPRGKLDVAGSFLGSVTDITPTNQTASLDCSLGNFFTLTLSSSADTFLTASNIQPGQSINLRITQPATSGSLSYGPEFKFPNGAPYAVSATGSVEDILSFIAFDASSLYGSSLKNFQ